MQHMQFIKLDLMARVNKIMTEQPITDIRWLLQPEIPPAPERHAPKPHPVDPDQKRLFQGMTEDIANQECRQALQRLWQTFASHTK